MLVVQWNEWILLSLDVEPESLDCEKPQSFENNFVHHMAIGETVVGTLWTSFAGICIEKLVDELLKVPCSSLSLLNARISFDDILEWHPAEETCLERISRCRSISDEPVLVSSGHDQLK